MKATVLYLSYSGNTEEVAELVTETLENHGVTTVTKRIGVGVIPNLHDSDVLFLGTFTWGKGRVPEEIKEFVLELGYKPKNVAVFGTGETQFHGEEWFCRAVDRLLTFYESPFEGLKIEQSPRGSQEILVKEWTERILKDVEIRKSQNISTDTSE